MMVQDQVSALLTIRKAFLNGIAKLSPDHMNIIPKGFNNNVAWHLGHLVASQQGICYLRSGQNIQIPEEIYEKYKPGTRPESFIEQEEIKRLGDLLLSLPEQFLADYQSGLFNNYQEWTSKTGFQIKNIENALPFLIFHESLHLGFSMALARQL